MDSPSDTRPTQQRAGRTLDPRHRLLMLPPTFISLTLGVGTRKTSHLSAYIYGSIWAICRCVCWRASRVRSRLRSTGRGAPLEQGSCHKNAALDGQRRSRGACCIASLFLSRSSFLEPCSASATHHTQRGRDLAWAGQLTHPLRRPYLYRFMCCRRRSCYSLPYTSDSTCHALRRCPDARADPCQLA